MNLILDLLPLANGSYDNKRKQRKKKTFLMCVCGGICTNKLSNLRLFDFRHICNHYCQDVSNFICTDRRTCRKS